MSKSNKPIISLKKVSKYYGLKGSQVKAVDQADLDIEKNAFTVILGRSGSGKSTLLNLMAGLDKISDGNLIADDRDLSKANSADLAKYRGQIGIIFQFYNLLPNLNTLENVLMGSWASGGLPDPKKALELLEQLGVGHRAEADVKTLSGGEKQRVAIARSLISDPHILFCDEPTGALDSKSEKQVQEILVDLHKNQSKTIVLVTHNPEFQEFANQIVTMEDGRIV